MKKFLTLILALVMVCSLSVTAFAYHEETDFTTLTVDIPNAVEPSFTIHVPANTTLEYGNTDKQEFGTVSVSDVTHDGTSNMQIDVRINYTQLINKEDSADEIALTLYYHYEGDPWDRIETEHTVYALYDFISSSSYEIYYGPITVAAEVTDWSDATAGATYQAVITFQFLCRP